MSLRRNNEPKPIEWERRGSCIISTGHALNENGYPCVRRNNRKALLHRLVCERRHGPLGKLFAIHSCDTPACINPDHLRPGTHAENMQDAKDRNRMFRGGPGTPVKGMDRSDSKLTDEQVREIRKAVGVQRIIGERFGVSQSVVSEIKSRKAWRHVQ